MAHGFHADDVGRSRQSRSGETKRDPKERHHRDAGWQLRKKLQRQVMLRRTCDAADDAH